jgi:lysophospholipase L1-like esterase
MSLASLLRGGALAAAALVVPLLAVPPASAAAPSYVALGDSYSSGTGTRSYLSDGTTCQRSTYAYPSLIAAARGYALNFRACSGARIPDVTSSQLGALSAATSYVSISVGGNDAGFSDVLTECAKPGWMSSCNGAIDKAQAYISGTLPGALGTLYSAIRSQAPNAKVVVVGYPRIFDGEDCNALTWFSPAEESRLNATADLLDSRAAAVAAAKGFAFANPAPRFVGHAVCDSVEWLNGLSSPITESYHPNRLGHASGYTPVVSPLLTGSTVTVTAATLRRARANADTLAAQQRRYAALDAGIEPESVRAPDLGSSSARDAARRAGIDLDRWLARH